VGATNFDVPYLLKEVNDPDGILRPMGSQMRERPWPGILAEKTTMMKELSIIRKLTNLDPIAGDHHRQPGVNTRM
jgi:hypothetical protein